MGFLDSGTFVWTQFSGPNKSRDEQGQITLEPLDFERDLLEHPVKREDSTKASLVSF